ncbi:MAG: hypothetical protein D3910_18530 [Candidatus Electrothrix sp. ATG2]|nr:hypothetical protein [Candidatus Electrothrix sp. ATG2]
MTDRAQEIWHGKRKYSWVHLSISQDIPPITGGSYKYQVWDLLKERADKDILICKYVPESFDIANKSECAVCQFDIYSVDIKTAITCRVNWLKRLLFRKGNNVFLESVAEWIRATGGKRIMIWGVINSLPELRRLLPEITIVYTQRHYRYAQRFNYYNYCDTLITQTHGQAKDAFTSSIRLDPFVVTIPNGVETDSFSPYSQDKKCEIRKTFGIVPESFVVVFPSKIALYKGSRYLERLIEISNDYFPEVLFLVIGGLHNLQPLSHQNKLNNLL